MNVMTYYPAIQCPSLIIQLLLYYLKGHWSRWVHVWVFLCVHFQHACSQNLFLITGALILKSYARQHVLTVAHLKKTTATEEVGAALANTPSSIVPKQ